MNTLQLNLNRNSNIFIHENALENVVCEIASILPRLQCVKYELQWSIMQQLKKSQASYKSETPCYVIYRNRVNLITAIIVNCN